MLVGGEALPVELARRLVASCGEVWNIYGPTEDTVWSTAARLEPGAVSIGRPIAETEALLQRATLVDAGAPVEELQAELSDLREFLRSSDLPFRLAKEKGRRAAELEPDDVGTWIFIGRLEQRAGNLGDAIAAAERASPTPVRARRR